MQDSWQRLMSDSTSWQKTLKNSHNLQSQWLVVSTLCQEMKNHLIRKVGFEGTPKLGLYWKSQPAYLQGKYGVEIRIESVNEDNSHSWVRISHVLNKLVTDLSNKKENDDNEQETSTTKTEVFAFKTEVFAYASRFKAKAKPSMTFNYLLIFKDCTYSWKNMDWNWTRSSIRSSFSSGKKNKHSSSTRRTTSRRRWERSNSGDWKMIFRTNLSALNIGLIMYGRARWQEAEATRKDFNIVLIRQDKKFFTFELFQCHPGRNYIDLDTAGQCIDSEQILRVHLSYWMCGQLTLHHKFRIDSREDKILAGTDGRYSLQPWIPCMRIIKIQ